MTAYRLLLGTLLAITVTLGLDDGDTARVQAQGCSGTTARAWVWVDGQKYQAPPVCVPAPGGWSKLTGASVDREEAGYGVGAEAIVYSPV